VKKNWLLPWKTDAEINDSFLKEQVSLGNLFNEIN